MKAIVIGCGRVGSSVAHELRSDGWDVVAVDQKEEALRRVGVEEADAVVVSTNGDNTNIVVAQVVQKRFGVQCVVVRILDPARAEFYAEQGMRTFCPTSTAIDALTEAVRRCVV